MNPFARTFVIASRIFGGFTAAGGALLLAIVILSFARGYRTASSSLGYAAVAVGLIAIGAFYLRAPLPPTRKKARTSDKEPV
jgi:hypothetical protein